MSDGGTWEPPRPEDGPRPSFGPPTASGPVGPTEPEPTAEPTASPPGRSTGKVVAAAIGAAVIVVAGVFAITRLAGDSAAGGASSPEAAGQALLDAIADEDVLGMIEVLLPGERETLRGPVTDLVEELQRLEVLDDDASLSGVDGVDLVVADESVAVRDTNVEDIANVDITASISGSIEGEALPIGDWIRENLDGDLAQLDADEPEATPATLPLTAVREDGRWYLSVFYTAAESVRADTGEDIPVDGIEPSGGDTPEQAVDAFLDGVEGLDVEAVIASLNPDEFAVLQRYAPLFLDDAQAAVDDADVTMSISERDYVVTGDGDTRSITVAAMTLDATVEGESVSAQLTDGCWTVTSQDETVNSCEVADSMPPLDDVFDDPQAFDDLLASFEATFEDYENPGFIVKEVDGEWYLSPLATGAENVLAVVRALSREEIEELQQQITDVVGSFDGEIFGTDMPPAADLTDEASDPSERCVAESDATAATACYDDLVASGEIDEGFKPWYLQAPECGLADVGWSGEYYELPDDEFVAAVDEAAPCFQELVASGEIDELVVPAELVDPECLDGRNPYTAADDQEYVDAFEACAYG